MMGIHQNENFPPFTFPLIYGTLLHDILKVNDKYSVRIHRKAETHEDKCF